MAKIRRIIRKLKPPASHAFDEQLWPVLLALCVLAGFAMGSILSYLRFDDPRWYANAATWLVLTALATAAVAVALARVDNRAFRRSMQLAIVLCLFFHALLLVVSIEIHIFDRAFEMFATQKDLAERKQPVTVPAYFQPERRDDARSAFERPVELETPAPEPEIELQRDQTQPTPPTPEVQPTPVPEPEETPRPTLMRREQLEETSPRHSDQQSLLSRRVTQSRPSPPSTRVDDLANQPAASPPSAALTASDSALPQRQTPAQMPRRDEVREPATSQAQPEIQIARRADSPTPEIRDSATPTFQRQMAPPATLPRTAADLSAPTAVSELTQPAELQPRTTLTRRQTTATPESVQPTAEPVPDTTAHAVSPPQRRQLRTEPRPELAQTPLDVPTQMPRATPRPEAVTSAREVTPADTARPPQPAPAESAAVDVARTRADRPLERPAVADEPAAAPIAPQTPRLTRSETAPTLAGTPESRPARQPPRPPAPDATAPATAVAAAVPAAQEAAAEPASEPTARELAAARRTAPETAARTAADTPAPDSPASTSAPTPTAITRARAEPSPTAVAAASAPPTTPRQATATPAPAADAAEAQAPAIVATGADAAAEPLAASQLTADRQSPPAPAASRPEALAGIATPDNTPGSADTAPSATRQARGPDTPQLARSDVTAPARRESPTALPSATTVHAEVAANLATAQAPSDQPRPSSATVARQPVARADAARSQQALEIQAASSSPQVARAAVARRQTPPAPSMTPASPSARAPARADLQAAVAASPSPVESPAVAQATRGVGDPSAAPARTAMNKAITGTAGIGSGRNLDRARPAADSPAMMASASARRAEATQDTPEGPDLAPSAPALVRRSTADRAVPAASLQAQPTSALATAAGADQPAELAASASATVRRADAQVAPGPTSAARGTTEVDIGPTQIVSEGQLGRASGGGQPALNFETDSPQLARTDRVGGAPLAALAASTVVEAPIAPPSDGGGQPPTPETEMPATAVARTDPGGEQPISGGPALATAPGSPTEISMAARVSETSLNRAELAEAVPGSPAAGGGEEEDEEERKRRLARAASRIAAIDTPTTAEAPAAAGVAAGDAPEPGPGAAATAIARADPSPAASGASEAAATPDPGAVAALQIADSPAGRAAADPQTPQGPLVAASPARSPRRTPGPASPQVATASAAVAPGDALAADPSGTAPPSEAAGTAIARAETGTSEPAASSPAAIAAEATPASLADATLLRTPAPESAPGAAGEPDASTAAPSRAIARHTHSGPPLELASSDPMEALDGVPGSGDAPAPVALAAGAATATREVGGGSPAVDRRATEAEPHAGSSGGELLASTSFNRAEAVEGATGTPVIGGGTHLPTRAAQGPTLAANLHAQTLQIAGAQDSAGQPDSSPLAAQGVEAARLAGGVRAPAASGPAGAIQDAMTLDVAMAGAPGTARATRSASPSTASGPAIDQAVTASPLHRADLDWLPYGAVSAGMVDLPDASGDAVVGQASLDHNLAQVAEMRPLSRQAPEGGLAVHLNAPAGTGGLSTNATLDVGLNHRRASSDSAQVQARTARFVRQDIGGLPNFTTTAIVAAQPFQHRTDRERGSGGGRASGTPPPMTEEAIEMGLAFLARHQLSDGSWSFQAVDQASAALVSDTAATGLALLSFQGAGYHHREHKYAERVDAAIRYLVKNQHPDGDLFVPLDDESNRSVWLYSHSIAALALCEAYGMTQDPELREPAQKSIDFLVASQHPDRGGWRYSPRYGSDTSVTGWAMMALKSGELANLDVPEEAYRKIRGWLDTSQEGDQAHLYRYNPYAPDTEEQRHGRSTSASMTSVGLLMRLYLGWHRDHPDMIRGAEFLAESPPMLGTTRRPLRDTYYWYYATQVMFHMGGDYWKAWNARLHPLLVNSQVRQGAMAGSWDPRNPLPDRWAPHAGRLYVTTMNLLSLEVYYRHLPLYEDTAR